MVLTAVVGNTDAKEVAIATCGVTPKININTGTKNPPPPPPNMDTMRPISNPNNGSRIKWISII
jgi:hypothetical protein